jgi:hypothetical protein
MVGELPGKSFAISRPDQPTLYVQLVPGKIEGTWNITAWYAETSSSLLRDFIRMSNNQSFGLFSLLVPDPGPTNEVKWLIRKEDNFIIAPAAFGEASTPWEHGRSCECEGTK